MPSVQLANVSKTYPGDVRAVVDLCLEIADGELVVLAGPSGCGKTTTLRMIAGLESPTTGDIRFDGQSVIAVPPDRRDVGMVFQSGALYPHMSVRKNLAFGLKTLGLGKAEIERRIAEAAELLHIAPLLDRTPDALSGGEAQRVAIGRAMVRRPQVYLFDEPLSNLDAQLRSQLRSEFATLHAQLSATMIYVTHDQAEAMTLADRLVVMKGGRIQQTGTPLEVYDRPASRFVAGFLGSPPMNFVEGAIAGGVFRAGELAWPVGSAADGRAVLGVRPEHLRASSDGERVFGRGTIERVEQLGHEQIVHVRAGKATLKLRSNEWVRLGESLSLTIGQDRYHLFAADEEGQTLDESRYREVDIQ